MLQLLLQRHFAKPLALLVIGLSFSCNPKADYQLIVYGATPAGIMAATAAAREGVSVLIIEPGEHIGGMVAGGLGRTDIGKKECIGGLSAKFLDEVASHTPRENQTPNRPWDLEAKVAKKVFNDWIAREKLVIKKNMRLKSVTKEAERITRITFEDGALFNADIFIDATYEGDLMAWSGVSYTIGRESSNKYNEPVAGFYQNPTVLYDDTVYCTKHIDEGGPKKNNPPYLHNTQFGADISPYDRNGQLLWGVNPGPKPITGTGDFLIQAYCFRLPATKRKDLLVPWPKPDNYYPERYELLLRYIEAHPCIRFTKLIHPGRIPNGKVDINACGPFTTDYVGGNTAYPDGNYKTRERIIQDHEDYQKGFFWFLAHDERVPERLRMEAQEWGLCKDEFPDNGHWPHQLYIREGRRMIGQYVMTYHDYTTNVNKEDAIGMASFSGDSHPVQRIVNEMGFVEEEGHFLVKTRPYEISYRVVTPRKSDCTNLLVPVCLSASHAAFGSVRMEPVYMLLGHATGLAASIAIKAGVGVQDINVSELQNKLRAEGQVLQYSSDEG